MATKQHNVRLPDDLAAAIERAVAERGYESASAFMRHAIQKELRHDDNAVAEVETRIAATLNRQAKDLRSVLYEKFLVSVAQNMASDAKAALREFSRLDTE